MTTPKGINRAVVALKLPRPVPALIKYGRAVVTAMTNNAKFTNPDPALASVTGIDLFRSLGESVTIVTGLIFIACVLAFRRGIVGEIVARVRPLRA